jgi:hypothetical protein
MSGHIHDSLPLYSRRKSPRFPWVGSRAGLDAVVNNLMWFPAYAGWYVGSCYTRSVDPGVGANTADGSFVIFVVFQGQLYIPRPISEPKL